MHENQVIMSALVVNHPGVLIRVAGLFSRRGFNIDSLTVSETENPAWSRMTISATGERAAIKQISRQLLKLEDVERLVILGPGDAVSAELLLVKVSADEQSRRSLLELAADRGAKVKDVDTGAVTLEYTGKTEALDEFIRELTPFGIRELARTGVTALERGGTVLLRDES